MKKGLFLVFGGGDGGGKSTISKMAAGYLSELGYPVILTKEPGATLLGVKIREILLDPQNKGMSDLAELFLFLADRAEHIGKLVAPPLKKGIIVISDRHSESTIAYQGASFSVSLLEHLCSITCNGITPDMTFILDVDPETGLNRNKHVGKNDRFELKDMSYHKGVRDRLLEFARRNSEKFKIIDASKPIDVVFSEVKRLLDFELGKRGLTTTKENYGIKNTGG